MYPGSAILPIADVSNQQALFFAAFPAEETEHIISTARTQVRPSSVANPKTGRGEFSTVRTSSGTFFGRNSSVIVGRVEERIARWSMLPTDHGEDMQVLYYKPTQRYDPHHDYFSFAAKDDNGGNRMATVLMYLMDVDEGGETVFPQVWQKGLLSG